MSEKAEHITSITSNPDAGRLDPSAHEINLTAVVSQQFSLNEVAANLTLDQKFYVLKRLEFGHLKSLEDLPPNAVFMLEKIEQMEINESLNILRDFLKDHEGDVNIPNEEYHFIELLANHHVDEKPAGLVKALDGGSSSDEKEVLTSKRNQFRLLSLWTTS